MDFLILLKNRFINFEQLLLQIDIIEVSKLWVMIKSIKVIHKSIFIFDWVVNHDIGIRNDSLSHFLISIPRFTEFAKKVIKIINSGIIKGISLSYFDEVFDFAH